MLNLRLTIQETKGGMRDFPIPSQSKVAVNDRSLSVSPSKPRQPCNACFPTGRHNGCNLQKHLIDKEGRRTHHSNAQMQLAKDRDITCQDMGTSSNRRGASQCMSAPYAESALQAEEHALCPTMPSASQKLLSQRKQHALGSRLKEPHG